LSHKNDYSKLLLNKLIELETLFYFNKDLFQSIYFLHNLLLNKQNHYLIIIFTLQRINSINSSAFMPQS